MDSSSNYKIIRKVIIKNKNNKIKNKNNKIKNLFDLIKLIKYKSIENLFNYLNQNNKKKLYEKLISILIKCYSNDLLFKNLKQDNLEKFFKSNAKIKNSILVFISSKYNNDNKDINNDKLEKLLININNYRKIYKKYDILLFVKNKEKINEVIRNSRNTKHDITNIIVNIMDYKDLKIYYCKLQNKLKNINLNISGEFNKIFINENCRDKILIKKFRDITI